MTLAMAINASRSSPPSSRGRQRRHTVYAAHEIVPPSIQMSPVLSLSFVSVCGSPWLTMTTTPAKEMIVPIHAIADSRSCSNSTDSNRMNIGDAEFSSAALVALVWLKPQ